jgi:hypothetical protein
MRHGSYNKKAMGPAPTAFALPKAKLSWVQATKVMKEKTDDARRNGSS